MVVEVLTNVVVKVGLKLDAARADDKSQVDMVKNDPTQRQTVEQSVECYSRDRVELCFDHTSMCVCVCVCETLLCYFITLSKFPLPVSSPCRNHAENCR